MKKKTYHQCPEEAHACIVNPTKFYCTKHSLFHGQKYPSCTMKKNKVKVKEERSKDMITNEELQLLKTTKVTIPSNGNVPLKMSDAYHVFDDDFLRWVESKIGGISLANRLKYRLKMLKLIKYFSNYKEVPDEEKT